MARTPQRKYTYSLSNKTSQQVRDFMDAHENDSFPTIMESLVAEHYALIAIKNGTNPQDAIVQAGKASKIIGDSPRMTDEVAMGKITDDISTLIKSEEKTTRKGIARTYDSISQKLDAVIKKQNEFPPETMTPTVSPDAPKIDEILSILRSFEIDGVKAKNINEIEVAARTDTGEAIDDTNLDLVEAILGDDDDIAAARPIDTESVRAAVSKVGDDTPFDGTSGDAMIADAIATAESTDDLKGSDVDLSGFDFNQEPDDDTKKAVSDALQEADERREIASGKYDDALKNILG